MIQPKMSREKGRQRENVTMDERREFPRFSREIYLRLYVHRRDDFSAGISSFTVRTLDVSRGGLRMESPQALTTGSRVGFESLDDASSRSISGIGEVMWCKPSTKLDNFEFGIAFPIVIEPRA